MSHTASGTVGRYCCSIHYNVPRHLRDSGTLLLQYSLQCPTPPSRQWDVIAAVFITMSHAASETVGRYCCSIHSLARLNTVYTFIMLCHSEAIENELCMMLQFLQAKSIYACVWCCQEEYYLFEIGFTIALIYNYLIVSCLLVDHKHTHRERNDCNFQLN